MQSKGIIVIEGTLEEFNKQISMLQKRKVLDSGLKSDEVTYWALVRFNGLVGRAGWSTRKEVSSEG